MATYPLSPPYNAYAPPAGRTSISGIVPVKFTAAAKNAAGTPVATVAADVFKLFQMPKGYIICGINLIVPVLGGAATLSIGDDELATRYMLASTVAVAGGQVTQTHADWIKTAAVLGFEAAPAANPSSVGTTTVKATIGGAPGATIGLTFFGVALIGPA